MLFKTKQWVNLRQSNGLYKLGRMLLSFDRFLDRYSVCSAEPDRFTLHQIARAFSHLPYENVTKILKEARSGSSQEKLRQAEEVLEDHLRWNTGGTCFSLCNALEALLVRNGFHAFIAMADMHYGSNIHCAVVVPLMRRDYLLDPGYLLHEPIPLPGNGLEMARPTPMNTVFIRSEGPGTFSLYTQETGQQKWRYRLRAWPVPRADFVQHWIHSFSLNSMEQLMLSRVDESGRLYFRKDRLEQVQPNFRSRKTVSGSEVNELSALFGLPPDLVQLAHKALLVRTT